MTSMTGRIPLGASGIDVAPMGWGLWRFAGTDRMQARARVDAALESGYTLFDVADVYGFDGRDGFGAAESLLGDVLRADNSLRSRVVLASKAGVRPPVPYDSRASYLVGACEASLRRLGTGHLDLFFIHRPDLLAHPQEMADALDRLRASGKIRAAGVSNFSAPQAAALAACLPFPLASVQVEFSPVAVSAMHDGVLDLAMTQGLGVLAWSPLVQGRLMLATATPSDARLDAVRAELDRIGAWHGVSRDVAAYAWIMCHPSRPIPLVGSQNPARIRAAVAACNVRIERGDWYRVLEAALGQRMP